MELGAIFLLIVVLVLVLLYVAKPFTRHWKVKFENSSELSTLLAERERSLNALQELDFDNGIGKVPADEYTVQRAGLIQKGSEILRRLDEIQSARPHVAKADVRKEIAEHAGTELSDEELETLVARRRAIRQQKSAGFCPNCGKPILQSDLFCPSCGQKLNPK
jgi:NADH pyrophosphatase NudC (nudix superfamily)